MPLKVSVSKVELHLAVSLFCAEIILMFLQDNVTTQAATRATVPQEGTKCITT